MGAILVARNAGREVHVHRVPERGPRVGDDGSVHVVDRLRQWGSAREIDCVPGCVGYEREPRRARESWHRVGELLAPLPSPLDAADVSVVGGGGNEDSQRLRGAPWNR